MTTLATVVHQDTLVANTLSLINLWREDGWDLSNQPAPVPVATLVYDLHTAAGVSDGAISMILGPDGEEITDPAFCFRCGGAGKQLVMVRSGDMVVCDEHAHQARMTGYIVITPLQ